MVWHLRRPCTHLTCTLTILRLPVIPNLNVVITPHCLGNNGEEVCNPSVQFFLRYFWSVWVEPADTELRDVTVLHCTDGSHATCSSATCVASASWLFYICSENMGVHILLWWVTEGGLAAPYPSWQHPKMSPVIGQLSFWLRTMGLNNDSFSLLKASVSGTNLQTHEEVALPLWASESL